jgi:hypothetical protein
VALGVVVVIMEDEEEEEWWCSGEGWAIWTSIFYRESSIENLNKLIDALRNEQ